MYTCGQFEHNITSRVLYGKCESVIKYIKNKSMPKNIFEVSPKICQFVLHVQVV